MSRQSPGFSSGHHARGQKSSGDRRSGDCKSHTSSESSASMSSSIKTVHMTLHYTNAAEESPQASNTHKKVRYTCSPDPLKEPYSGRSPSQKWKDSKQPVKSSQGSVPYDRTTNMTRKPSLSSKDQHAQERRLKKGVIVDSDRHQKRPHEIEGEAEVHLSDRGQTRQKLYHDVDDVVEKAGDALIGNHAPVLEASVDNQRNRDNPTKRNIKLSAADKGKSVSFSTTASKQNSSAGRCRSPPLLKDSRSSLMKEARAYKTEVRDPIRGQERGCHEERPKLESLKRQHAKESVIEGEAEVHLSDRGRTRQKLYHDVDYVVEKAGDALIGNHAPVLEASVDNQRNRDYPTKRIIKLSAADKGKSVSLSTTASKQNSSAGRCRSPPLLKDSRSSLMKEARAYKTEVRDPIRGQERGYHEERPKLESLKHWHVKESENYYANTCVRVQDSDNVLKAPDWFKKGFLSHSDLDYPEEPVMVKEFARDETAEEYYYVLNILTHPNILKPLGIFHGPASKLVMFSPASHFINFQSFLKTYWAELWHTRTTHQEGRMKPKLIEMIRSIATTEAYIHNSRFIHGPLNANTIFVEMSDPEDVETAVIKLVLPGYALHCRSPTKISTTTLERLHREEWKSLQGLIHDLVVERDISYMSRGPRFRRNSIIELVNQHLPQDPLYIFLESPALLTSGILMMMMVGVNKKRFRTSYRYALWIGWTKACETVINSLEEEHNIYTSDVRKSNPRDLDSLYDFTNWWRNMLFHFNDLSDDAREYMGGNIHAAMRHFELIYPGLMLDIVEFLRNQRTLHAYLSRR